MDRLWQMNGWLAREARFLDTNLELFGQFCMKLLELGVLLDRSWLHTRALHPNMRGWRGCGRGRLVSRSAISTMGLRRRALI
jgi:hypothetical protein